MAHQIPLHLRYTNRYSATDFVVSEANQALFDDLKSPELWVNPYRLLIGPEGTGKTHALSIFLETPEAGLISNDTVPDPLPRHIAIDDAETYDQETLFHLFNRTTAENGRLLLASRLHPHQWKLSVPDLASRLGAMQVVEMPEPDDELLKKVLKRLFALRAITPSDEVLDYLSRRMERSFASAQKIVTGLEDYANGRAFTRALAREFIDKCENLSWLTDWDEI